MKKLHLLGMAMIIALAFASCGSNKQMVNNQPQQQNQQQNQSNNVSNNNDLDQQLADIDKQIALEKKKQELEKVKQNLHADPCSEYYDDENFMRDYGIATHVNKESAQALSEDAAKENLKKHMAEFVQGMTKSYRSLHAGSKDTDDIQRKIEGNFNSAVNGLLDRARKLCQLNEKDGSGRWVYYAAFEIAVKDFKAAVTNSVDQLSKEEKLLIDYKQKQFEKEFDEDFQKMLDAQKEAGY